MEENVHRPRLSSERLRRKIAYSFANRVDTFAKFKKTKEEKEQLKKIKSDHTKALMLHYKEKYTKKIMNLPDFVYGISINT